MSKGGALGVMCSYNAINGTPACAHPLLFRALRGTWGFEGYVTSDSDAILDIYQGHAWARTPEEGVASALRAGTDIDSCLSKGRHSSTGGEYMDHLPSAIAQGLVSEQDIDTALRRTLGLRFRLGLFDPIEQQQPLWHVSPKEVASARNSNVARRAARESLVLLQNPGASCPGGTPKARHWP